MSEPACDTIIVGAGTAGCLLANRLSADAAGRAPLRRHEPLKSETGKP